MKLITRTLLRAAALAVSLPLVAQTTPAQPSAEPAPYRSAFEGYRPFQAGEVQDWRKSNDTVREIGGWRAYAREIQQGAKEQPAQAPKRSTGGQAPAASPHQGHGK
jgi:hypothetical protein